MQFEDFLSSFTSLFGLHGKDQEEVVADLTQAIGVQLLENLSVDIQIKTQLNDLDQGFQSNNFKVIDDLISKLSARPDFNNHLVESIKTVLLDWAAHIGVDLTEERRKQIVKSLQELDGALKKLSVA